MTARVRLSAGAEADIAEAFGWYERVQPGLGSTFVDAVEASLTQVAEFPNSGQMVSADARRVLMRRFPYGLLYVVNEDELFVLGCVHLRRDPRVWSSRGSLLTPVMAPRIFA